MAATSDVVFGGIWPSQPIQNPTWVNIQDGTYPSVTFKFTDTFGSPIFIYDPRMSMLVTFPRCSRSVKAASE